MSPRGDEGSDANPRKLTLFQIAANGSSTKPAPSPKKHRILNLRADKCRPTDVLQQCHYITETKIVSGVHVFSASIRYALLLTLAIPKHRYMLWDLVCIRTRTTDMRTSGLQHRHAVSGVGIDRLMSGMLLLTWTTTAETYSLWNFVSVYTRTRDIMWTYGFKGMSIMSCCFRCFWVGGQHRVCYC